MRLAEALTFTMRLAGTLIVTFSLFFYMAISMSVADHPPWSRVVVPVTSLLVVALVMIAARPVSPPLLGIGMISHAARRARRK